MLVERGIQVMNFEVVGDAYTIASNYLHKTGAIADSPSSGRTAARDHREDGPARRIQQDPARQQGDLAIRSEPARLKPLQLI